MAKAKICKYRVMTNSLFALFGRKNSYKSGSHQTFFVKIGASPFRMYHFLFREGLADAAVGEMKELKTLLLGSDWLSEHIIAKR